MAYVPIVRTQNLMEIKEKEYGIGSPLQTSHLDSCIVVVGAVTNQNNLLAIHLVIIDKEHDQFDDEAADEVRDILTTNNVQLNNAWMVGQLNIWGPGQPSGYNRLIQNLGIQGNQRQEQTQQGEVKFTFDNSQARKFRVEVI